MRFNDINKEIIAGVASALAACLLITSIPYGSTGTVSMENDTEIFDIQASAGANASINNSNNSTMVGASGAVTGGTVGVVDNDNNTVGQPSDEENDIEQVPETPEVVYETFGYTNLGMVQLSSGNLNIRNKPSTSGAIVGKFINHNACEILGEENGWYKIKSGKVEGYVSGEYIITGEEALILAQSEAKLIATVTADILNVRSKPSTDGRLLDGVAKGEEITVVFAGIFIPAESVSVARTTFTNFFWNNSSIKAF